MDTYNGWVNRETWCMYSWLTSDEGLYRSAIEYIESDIRLESLLEALEDFEPILYRQIKDDVGSIYRVDWYDVEEAFKEE